MGSLKELDAFGQSIWLDFLSRGLIARGELKKLIDEWGVKGLTSNPSIFQKAVEHGADYDALFAELGPRKLDAMAFFDELALRDIRDAADLFRPVYEATGGKDGFVSIEVSPRLAHQTQASLEEARRLWKAVDRPNVMIKIPGTAEGLPAIEQALTEGININITLLFSQERYQEVAEAYVRALEARHKAGQKIGNLASVASFFVSRIDTLADELLAKKLESAKSPEREKIASLMGKVAIANAKQAYERYQKLFSGPRWEALAKAGAVPQRLLWASTSTKNPKYRDVIYVEELIGSPTVNTVPMDTLEAYRDHGKPRASLGENLAGAARTMADLSAVGLSMKAITDQLVDEGVKKFDASFDTLLSAIAKRLEGGQG